jgi:hypothetical protein
VADDVCSTKDFFLCIRHAVVHIPFDLISCFLPLSKKTFSCRKKNVLVLKKIYFIKKNREIATRFFPSIKKNSLALTYGLIMFRLVEDANDVVA